MYPQLPQLINELVRRKYYVYCCTNGLLLERVMRQVPPSPYLCWVLHLDGMERNHDISVARKGVWRVAMKAARTALDRGYRVTCNTTLFKGSDPDDLHRLFDLVTRMGFEGIMVSAGYDYESVPNQDVFLTRQGYIEVFRRVLADDKVKRFRFYNNPLYLDFLRGRRNYQCTAYSNPTYTVMGWRKPCYCLADGHTRNLGELFEESLWRRYGVGRNPKCANCMMHCGFESATIFQALSRPMDMLALVKGILLSRGGVGAS